MRLVRLSYLCAPLFLLFTACPGGGGNNPVSSDPCANVICGAGICVQNGTAGDGFGEHVGEDRHAGHCRLVDLLCQVPLGCQG